MKKLPTCLFVLLLSLCAVPSRGGDIFPEVDTRLKFRYLSVNDGLSQNSVTSIVQDKDGLILIATYDGINRFDGYRIVSDRHSLDVPQGPVNNRIVCMLPCDDGTVWMGLDGGLMRYDPGRNRYIDHTPSLGALRSRWVRSLCRDKAGDLWIGTDAEVVCGRYEEGEMRFREVGGLGGAMISSIACDPQGGMWIGSSRGLFICRTEGCRRTVTMVERFRGRAVASLYCDSAGTMWVGYADGLAVCADGERFTEIVFPGLDGGSVDCALRDREGNLWLGVKGKGLFRLSFDPEFRVLETVHYDTSDFFGRLTDNDVCTLYIDRSNVLWVGTRRGVNYADLSQPNLFTFKPLVDRQLSELGYRGRHINALFIDSRDDLWISTYKEGLYRYDFGTRTLRNVSSEVTSSPVARIIETRDGSLLFAAREGVYRVRRTASGGVSSRKLRLAGVSPEDWQHYRYYIDLCEDRYGDIWVATVNGLIRYFSDSGQSVVYTQDYGLASDSPYCLLSDTAARTVWVGSSDRGLSRIRYGRRGESLEVQAIRHGDTPFGLSHDQVWSLLKDSRGVIWIGTDAGLNRMETAPDGRIVSLERVTLPWLRDAKILAITEDREGDLWFNSSQGLYRYQPASGHVRRYIWDDGLQSNTWTEGAAVSDNGWIFVGGINGVNYFNPARFRENLYSGRPVFTDLKVFNRSVRVGEEYGGRTILPRSINSVEGFSLGHRFNNFTLEFTSDHYVTPKKNMFRYRLEGYDREWITVSSGHRYASYANLPAGTYTFRLQSSNNDGAWSDDVRQMNVQILPAPWATWWAFSIYALLLGGAVMAVVNYVRAKQRWKRELFMQKVEQEKTLEMNELKLNFFTNVTHELGTPLSLILAPLKDLMNHKGVDGYSRFRLQIIHKNTNKLLLLINQILDIRRLSVQSLPLAVSQGDLVGTVREVVHSFGYLSEQTGIVLRFDCPDRIEQAWFDRGKIEKVVQNILSNAYKFTPEQGRIEVRLWVETLNGRRRAHVSVQDSGVGIPEREQDKIFDLFYRGTPLSGYSSGVGLALCKALMELHGGSIAVRSRSGEGSTFTVEFPVDREAFRPEQCVTAGDEGPAAAEPVSRPPEEGKEPRKYLILVVEDNRDMCDYIRECLRGHFRVEIASDGEQGLAMAQKLIPAAVITDIMMPGMDGIEFIRRLKENPRTNFIPVIVHSVKEDKASVREALTAGAQEYIVKPFDSENLVFRIRNLLSTRESYARKLRTEKITEPTPVEVPSSDEQLLRRISRIVERNLQNPLFDIDQLSEELGMSRMQLYRRLKKIAGGRTVSEMVRDIRLRRAAQLLASGQMRVAEVMFEVGINNHYRFVRYFQEAYGLTPKEYMKKYAEAPAAPPREKEDADAT